MVHIPKKKNCLRASTYTTSFKLSFCFIYGKKVMKEKKQTKKKAGQKLLIEVISGCYFQQVQGLRISS